MSRKRRFALLTVLGVVILLGSSLAGYVYAYNGRIAPHSIISGISTGYLTRDQAQVKLAAQEQSFLTTPLQLTQGGRTWKVQPKQLGVSFSNEAALDEAVKYSGSGVWYKRLGHLVEAPFRPRHYSPTLSSVGDPGKAYLTQKLGAAVEKPLIQTSLDLAPGAVTITPGTAGQLIDYASLSQAIAQAYTGQSTAIALKLTPSEAPIPVSGAAQAQAQAQILLSAPWTVQAGPKSFPLTPTDLITLISTTVQSDGLQLGAQNDALQALITKWATQVNTKPANAVLTTSDGQAAVITPGVDGLNLDQTGSISTLTDLITGKQTAPENRTIILPTAVAKAAITQDSLASLGVTQLIGTGTTDYTGSPSNRIANITTGAKSINGQLIQPGDTFSTIGTLGPIDQAHGYVQGLVIVNNQTLPADGGGLCQVSTTLFRAVLNAGLPVTARSPHSYEVSYYQRGIGPGLDATIYDPKPDFAWKNDTGHIVYIQATIKGKALTFDLYGTSDGRTASINGPTVLSTTEPSGDPIYVNSASLKKGVTQLIDPPIQGAKTTASYTVTRDGQVINQQTFNSTYKAMPAQYLVGTS